MFIVIILIVYFSYQTNILIWFYIYNKVTFYVLLCNTCNEMLIVIIFKSDKYVYMVLLFVTSILCMKCWAWINQSDVLAYIWHLARSLHRKWRNHLLPIIRRVRRRDYMMKLFTMFSSVTGPYKYYKHTRLVASACPQHMRQSLNEQWQTWLHRQ